MDKVYEARLRVLLDEIYITTAATVLWTEIYMWFGIQKITKAPYRHIQKEWEEVCDLHQRGWPDRTFAPKLYMLKSERTAGLILRRELFDDESLVDFDQLAA